jgi:hypothetical protein
LIASSTARRSSSAEPARQWPNRPLTLDDVTRIAEADPGHRFELSEENLLIKPPGTWRHQKIPSRSRLDPRQQSGYISYKKAGPPRAGFLINLWR